MADVIPLVLLVFGFVAFLKPGWIAVLDRGQKAAGTVRTSAEIIE